jgi:adenylate cyclase
LEAFVFGEVIPMAEEKFKRKLTAILSADVAGYSRLMAEDESATVKTLETYREVMSTLIIQHRGRVIDSPGDNLLAEFTSVVDAVQCAVAVQKEFQARNAELPENRRMEFRIGVNLGDVIEEGERIYGDGVNIAARLEALADPGGICVSKTAFDHIESKLPLGYEYLGEQEVKNIPKPVGAYRVLMEPRVTVAEEIQKVKAVPVWQRKTILAAGLVLVVVVIAALIWNSYLRPPPMEVASVEKMAFSLPDEPSIAVLPFTNLSGDPEQEYFSDGLTGEIITSLSMVPRLFVIARTSTFTYKGKTVKVQQVAEEMGVRYVLEGSVQKSGEKLRITAQLIDALTGRPIWAERYDRDLKDIFALQDEVTMKILTALQVKLTHGEIARLFAKGTDNPKAHIKFLQGHDYFLRFSKEGNLQARKLAEEAIALDPEYASAYCLLGQTHYMAPYFGLSKSPRKSYQESAKLLRKALALDESHHLAISVLAVPYWRQRQYEKALAQAERAVALYPNMDVSNVNFGAALFLVGRYEEAVQSLEKAIRLNPKGPTPFFTILGWAYCFAGRYEDAIAALKKAIDLAPNSPLVHTHLSAIYNLAGREEEARAEAGEVLRLDPMFSLERYGKALAWRKVELEPWLDALRKAGLPETPPLPLPDKPSIAVLPFVNMSGDPEQEYLSDGFSVEIITALSKTPKMFVIARTSSFKYKGKEIDVRTVGRELGVRYILEGSVRRSEDRLRVTAKLVDAKTGNHLWAERYDREMKDIFAVQDVITKKIITALQVELTDGELARFAAKGTENLQAYLNFMQGREAFLTITKEGDVKARRLFEEAIALDQEYAAAYIYVGATHWMDVVLGSSKSRKESLNLAFKYITKGKALDESHPWGHHQLGWLYLLMKRQHDKGIVECERAITLAPNSANAHFWMSLVLMFAGRQDESVQYAEQTLRLDPFPTHLYFRQMGSAYSWVGRYEEAIAFYKKAIQGAPNDILTHRGLTYTYSWAGRLEEARAQAEEVLKINPRFCIRGGPGVYKNPADMELVRNGLRKAGLPDCPPREGSK